MTATMPNTTLRNADLSGLLDLLKKQADVKYDVVVTQDRITMVDGDITIAGAGLDITDDGVDEVALRFAPTDTFDEGLAERLGIPRAYLRRLRTSEQEVTLRGADYETGREAAVNAVLLDANVNGWLQAEPSKKMLVRAFHTGDSNDVGIARAFLSDRFAPIDNYDVLLAALAGIKDAGVNVVIDGADLTERAMRVRLYSPDVVAMAPVLLQNYRTPFERDGAIGVGHGQAGLRDGDGNLPVVWGGFEIRNGETGGSSFQIVPRLVVEACTNGMTVTAEAFRQVHLGARLDEGVVRWSEDTQRKSVELVTARTRDAVTSFLDPEWVAQIVAKIESEAGAPVADAVSTIERVSTTHGFTEAEQASILDCFIKSGDLTAGGVMQAVTAAAQIVESADRAMLMEDSALDVLHAAAAV